LAAQVSEENFEKGLIFPPFTNIRKISAHIAAKVATKAYELGELLPFHFLSINSLKQFHEYLYQ
jgi:malic enzyme